MNFSPETQFVAELLAPSITKAISAATTSVAKYIRGLTSNARAELDAYTAINTEYCSHLANPINFGRQSTINDYLSPTVLFNKNYLDPANSPLAALKERRSFALTGQAGIGKTAYIKRAFIEVLADRTRIPILIEFRKIRPLLDTLFTKDQFLPQLSIIIFEYLHGHLASLSRETWLRGLNCGAFCILLDGLDEVPKVYQEQLCERIAMLFQTYQQCTFMVSTRYGNDLGKLNSYNIPVAELQPLDYDQTILLIKSNIDFKKEYIDAAIDSLTPELFNEFGSILGVPLLAVFYLLSCKGNRINRHDINVLDFYRSLYHSMLNLQDSVKECGPSRERSYHISEDQYILLIAEFAANTIKFKNEPISSSEAAAALSSCKRFEGTQGDTASFLHDIVQFFSFLTEDHGNYYYNHRSILEFYAAYHYATDSNSTIPADDLIYLAEHWSDDTTLCFLFNLSRKDFAIKFLQPLRQAMADPKFASTAGLTIKIEKPERHSNDVLLTVDASNTTKSILSLFNYLSFSDELSYTYRENETIGLPTSATIKVDEFLNALGKTHYRDDPLKTQRSVILNKLGTAKQSTTARRVASEPEVEWSTDIDFVFTIHSEEVRWDVRMWEYLQSIDGLSDWGSPLYWKQTIDACMSKHDIS